MKTIALVPIVMVGLACSNKPASVYAPDETQVSIERVDGGCVDADSCEWGRKSVVADIVISVNQLGDPAGHCPSDMRYVEGDYCDRDNQECLKWRDNAIGERCMQWRVPDAKHPWKCLGNTKHIAACLDVYEYPNKKGELPKDWMSWYDCRDACAANGKRMLTKSEWSMAALGPHNWPYPFGSGYTRDNSCNMDRKVRGVKVMKLKDPNSSEANIMRSYIAPSGSLPKCHSEFGVYDLAGNLDEYVINESGRPYISGLVGGHFTGVRNASRPMTTAHYPGFRWWESSCRCARDVDAE